MVAEDNAIEDSIYHLHRALNTGRIDLERFLRVSFQGFISHSHLLLMAVLLSQSTRVLAEEQFTKRALIEKIQHGIPTASYS